MRDYTKQNKAVFLSDGRCVFEEDAPKYQEQQKQRDELLASKEIPVVRGSTHSNMTGIRYLKAIEPSVRRSLLNGNWVGPSEQKMREWVGNREVKEFRIGEMNVITDSTLRPDQGYFISENAKNAEFNKPHVLRNCNSCKRKWSMCGVHKGGDNPVFLWMKDLGTKHGWGFTRSRGVPEGADNCPGWKEK